MRYPALLPLHLNQIFFINMATAASVNDECDEKVIIAFCEKVNRRSGLFHLEERVLWYCLNKVKAHVIKQHWGTGVDTLKLNSNGTLKVFILKIFASQKFSNYDIKIGIRTLNNEVAKVSPFLI